MIAKLFIASLFFGTALIAWLWYVLNTGPIVLN